MHPTDIKVDRAHIKVYSPHKKKVKAKVLKFKKNRKHT